MSEVNRVCQSLGIKTGPIPQGIGQDIDLANDFLEFGKVLQVVETLEQHVSQVGRFSRKAARTYQKNQRKVEAEISRRDEPFNLPSPIEQVILVLTKTIDDISNTPRGRAGTARDREGFEKLRAYYTSIHRSLQDAKNSVSPGGWQVFETIWTGVQDASQVDRLKSALQQRIRSLKSKLNAKNIYDPKRFIDQACRKHIFVKRPPKPPTSRPAPPKPPKPSRFSWGARLWAGSGKPVLGLLAAGASAEYKISQSLRLRLDYDFYAAYDFESDLAANDDLAMVSIVGDSYFAQAGFRYYRNDSPTLIRPDQHMAVLSGGKRFYPKENFSIDFAGTFQIGSADNGVHANLLGSGGITYRSGGFMVSPALVGGAIVEDAEKLGIVGGELRAGLDLGRFGLDLKGYGIGYLGNQSHIGWLLQGRISFFKNWNLLLSAGPGEFASGDEDSTVSFHGGLGISYGLSGTGPKPLLFEPIHYIMGSNRYGSK